MVYKILSKHVYRGSTSVFNTDAIKIPPDRIRSMENIPNTISSYGYGKAAGPLKYHKPDGSIVAMHRTSGNIWETPISDFKKYGNFSPQHDDVFRYSKWKIAGEDIYPNKSDRIPKMPDITYIGGIGDLRMHLPDKRDTKVRLYTTPRLVEAVDPNKIGFFEHKKSNAYHDLRSMIDNTQYRHESEDFIKFLEKKGITIKDKHPVLGLGIEKGDFLAAYYPNQKYLVTEFSFHNKIKRLVSKYGLSKKEAIEAIKAFKRSGYIHESFVHGAAEIGGDSASEELQGRIAEEFYSIMAKNHKGTKMERVYKALAEEGKHYAKEFSFKNSLLREITKDIYPEEESKLEILVSKFDKEGRILGKKGKELVEYVEERMQDTYGKLSELEALMEKSDKASSSIDKSEYKSMSDAKEKEEPQTERAEASDK